MSRHVGEAEEIREHIKSKNFTKSGLERMFAVLLAQLSNLEERKKKGDEAGYQILGIMNQTEGGTLKLIDSIAETAKTTGEIEEDDDDES